MLNSSTMSIRREQYPLFVVGLLLGLLCLSMMALAQGAPDIRALSAADSSLQDFSQRVASSAVAGVENRNALPPRSSVSALMLQPPPNNLVVTGTVYFDAARTNATVDIPAGSQAITVTSAVSFAVGDEILIIDMGGAGIGTWETGIVSDVVTNTLMLTGTLQNAYAGTTDKIVVQEVPHYTGVRVKSGGKLTVDAWDGETGGLIFFRAVTVTVEASGSIDVSQQGYNAASGAGKPTSGRGGAGHGGYGGMSGTSPGGLPYGDVYEPAALGSGGGGPKGGAGGGAIHLVVSGTLTMSGTISADGSNGLREHTYGPGDGGGSGGSILIEAAIITGNGTIRANGGTGASSYTGSAGGGGAGGRIVLLADTVNWNGTVQATGGGGGQYGGPGTIYRRHDSMGLGVLHIDNASHDSESAALLAGAYRFDQIELTSYGHLTILDPTSVLTLTNSTLAGDGTSRLAIEGEIRAPVSLTVSGALLAVYGELTGPETITTAGNGGVELRAQTPGGYTFTQVTVGAGTILQLVPHDDGDEEYSDDYPLKLCVENLTIESGAIVSGAQGYNAQLGPGAPPSSGKGGAGHGGYGGRGDSGVGGTPYGDLYQPVALGSGGDGSVAGAGGGAIHLIVSDTLTVEGTLAVDGYAGKRPSSYVAGHGGGSGGSLWIEGLALTALVTS